MAKIANVQEVSLKKLKPYERNAKKHGENQIEKLKASINEFGFLTPCLIDNGFNLIAGHGRVMAAKELGIESVPCVFIEGLSEEQRRAYILADNRLGELGEWDMDIVWDELSELDELGFDVELTGFEMPEEIPEVIEDDFDESAVPDEPRSKLGDLWQLGDHRLICGDSTDVNVIERLMGGVQADLVLTDPPYGINLDTDYSGISANWKGQVPYAKSKKYSKVANDAEHYDPQHIFRDFGYVNETFLWGGNYYADQLPNLEKSSWIVWDKTGGHTQQVVGSEFELLWSKTKHKQIIIDYKWSGVIGLSQQDLKSRQHPTQKPLQVLSPIIDKYTDEGDNVVDIFGGSGSTLIACEQLNRKCYMCELDEHYCDVIISRWETLTGREAVLINE